MSGIASAERYIERLRGHIYQAAAPASLGRPSLTGWGSSDQEPESISLSHDAAPRKPNEVEISSRASGLTSPGMLIHALMFRAIDTSTPKFPLAISIEEGQTNLVLDGHEHPFTLYTCGDRSVAVANLDGVGMTVEAPTVLLADIKLAQVDAESLAVLIQQFRRSHGWHRG